MNLRKNLTAGLTHIGLQGQKSKKPGATVLVGAFLLLCVSMATLAGGNAAVVEAPSGSSADRLASEEMIKAGELTFSQNCTYCHGYRGIGGKARKMQCRDTYTPDYVFTTISNGKQRGSLIMPPWKDSFSEETRWQLVAYILSLKTLPACSE
ncbi:c-type cytochrome [Porticoccus sp.]